MIRLLEPVELVDCCCDEGALVGKEAGGNALPWCVSWQASSAAARAAGCCYQEQTHTEIERRVKVRNERVHQSQSPQTSRDFPVNLKNFRGRLRLRLRPL